MYLLFSSSSLFFFNDTATTEIYTLSLHDALPIYPPQQTEVAYVWSAQLFRHNRNPRWSRRWCASVEEDRKSTRLNSSHQIISYAVFCLKKKKKTQSQSTTPSC